MTFLSAVAIVCLPRQFQVTVVENLDERHLATATWLFPLYLLGISLFIVPIALVGLGALPAGSNPDLFVLTLPLQAGRDELALLAFLGGFSSAASMVIVAAIAVSTMVSNHIVMPAALQLSSRDRPIGDVRRLLLTSRRVSIALILGLGLVYFRLSGGSDALSAIGLVAFVGVAQFLPGLVGGLYWRGATRAGALAGLGAGRGALALHAVPAELRRRSALRAGGARRRPLGRGAQDAGAAGPRGPRPAGACTGLESRGQRRPLPRRLGLHAPRPLERLRGALFVDVFRAGGAAVRAPSFVGGTATAEDLLALGEHILGRAPARGLFAELARGQGWAGELPLPTGAVLARLERELSGSVGAASAHAMVGRIAAPPERSFGDKAAWEAHLATLAIPTADGSRDPARVASEGALWGGLVARGFADTVVLSDDAGQFNVGRHALCWVHAERQVHKLDTFCDRQAHAKAVVQAGIWELYRDLKATRATRRRLTPPRFGNASIGWSAPARASSPSTGCSPGRRPTATNCFGCSTARRCRCTQTTSRTTCAPWSPVASSPAAPAPPRDAPAATPSSAS